jgi:hypothetical protein
VNVWGLPYVVPHSMPPTGQESGEQTRAYRKMNAERKRIRPLEPLADHNRAAERKPTAVSGSATVGSALRAAAMTTAMAVMTVATAVVDGNAE